MYTSRKISLKIALEHRHHDTSYHHNMVVKIFLTWVDTIKLSKEYSPNYVFEVQEEQVVLGLCCCRIESYIRKSIVAITIYYMYEKGELNRKGGEGAEYKTIVITANVQWAGGDAGKLWYLMHFTATCSPSGLTNAIAKQPLSHTTDERLEVEIPRKWAWRLSYFKICW